MVTVRWCQPRLHPLRSSPREFFVLSRTALRRTPPRPVPSCPSARAFSSSFVLPTVAAAALVVTATGATVAHPCHAADPRARRHPDRHGPHRAGLPTRRWSPTSPSVARPRRSRPPPSRAATSRPPARPAPPSARPPPRPKAEPCRQALGAPDPHLEHHLRLRLALGQDPRRHRPRRHHRHPDLRDVQGRGHRLVLRLQLRQQGRDQVLGRLDLLVRPHEQADRPEGRHRACRASSSAWSATPATPSARTCTSRSRRRAPRTAPIDPIAWLKQHGLN